MLRAEFSQNLRTLAMPGGRLTGTPNAQQAERFVADKLRAYGLKNVHFEPFEMQSWIVHKTEVALLTDPPRSIDGALALAYTLPTPPGGVTAELVDLGEGQDDDFAAHAEDLKGRFAFIQQGHRHRVNRVQLACQHGAAGVVFMSPAERAPVIGNGHETARPEPVVVIPHDRDLLDRLAAGEKLRMNVQLATEVWDCRPNNVVGEIPGRGPFAKEIVILCAHLDSWHLAEGGMDNGSGSATILETARSLAAVGWQPRRTVRFVWFMAEELGLNGSTAYVREHADELDRIVAVINEDMPGSPRNFGVFGHPEMKPFLEDFIADLRGYELDPGVADWNWEGSDHSPFMKAGVCALSLGGELGLGVKFYHTAGDTYETVDRRGTLQSSAVLAVLIRRLADADERPTVRLAPRLGTEPRP